MDATTGAEEPAGEPTSDRRRAAFRAVLFLVAALVVTAGFFGGAMIYGLDHYALPS